MLLALTGFPGSGKSSVGRELSALTGWPFTDLDAEVERLAGKNIADIFAEDGEDGFRNLETEALRGFCRAAGEDCLLALGGGSLLRPENADILRGRPAKVVWLEATPENLLTRLMEGTSGTRPLLIGNVQGKLGKLLESRAGHYGSHADITVSTNGRNPSEVAAEILRKI